MTSSTKQYFFTGLPLLTLCGTITLLYFLLTHPNTLSPRRPANEHLYYKHQASTNQPMTQLHQTMHGDHHNIVQSHDDTQKEEDFPSTNEDDSEKTQGEDWLIESEHVQTRNEGFQIKTEALQRKKEDPQSTNQDMQGLQAKNQGLQTVKHDAGDQRMDWYPSSSDDDDDPSKKLICFKLKGRLGNHLFQYASILGLAWKLNRVPVFTIVNVSKHFLSFALEHPPPEPSEEQTQRCSKARFKLESGCCRFDPLLLDMKEDKDYRVGAFLESWKYFEGYEDRVRKAVVPAFKETFRQRAAQTVRELRAMWEKNRVLIGVHVRREDYLWPEHVEKGYRAAPPSYYRKAMDYMRTRLGNDIAFVVSAENGSWFLDSVVTTSSSDDVAMLARAEEAEVDLLVLTSLDHVIISQGTFGWWVGFLSQGMTVCWPGFIVPGTYIGDSFDKDGASFLYPGWIRIDS